MPHYLFCRSRSRYGARFRCFLTDKKSAISLRTQRAVLVSGMYNGHSHDNPCGNCSIGIESTIRASSMEGLYMSSDGRRRRGGRRHCLGSAAAPTTTSTRRTTTAAAAKTTTTAFDASARLAKKGWNEKRGARRTRGSSSILSSRRTATTGFAQRQHPLIVLSTPPPILAWSSVTSSIIRFLTRTSTTAVSTSSRMTRIDRIIGDGSTLGRESWDCCDHCDGDQLSRSWDEKYDQGAPRFVKASQALPQSKQVLLFKKQQRDWLSWHQIVIMSLLLLLRCERLLSLTEAFSAQRRTTPPPPRRRGRRRHRKLSSSSSASYFFSTELFAPPLEPIVTLQEQNNNHNNRGVSSGSIYLPSSSLPPLSSLCGTTYNTPLSITYTNDPLVVEAWIDKHITSTGCCLVGFDVEVSSDSVS